MIIDTHVHMYPGLEYGLQKLGIDINTKKLPFKKIKSIGLKHRQKWNMLMQDAASNMRKLPQRALPFVEKAHALSTIGNVAICCSKEDLIKSMDENGIDRSIVIAHPPLIPNEFILSECNNNDRLLPVVNIPNTVKDPKKALRDYVDQGAVALKIHAAADGKQNEDNHYRLLLEQANDLKLPVIIHTGCIHIQPAYKNPDMGHAKHFEPWFKEYPNVSLPELVSVASDLKNEEACTLSTVSALPTFVKLLPSPENEFAVTLPEASTSTMSALVPKFQSLNSLASLGIYQPKEPWLFVALKAAGPDVPSTSTLAVPA